MVRCNPSIEGKNSRQAYHDVRTVQKRLDGIDISKDKMEVGPTAHYSMGGVVVDIKCRTKIRGLFAVGEVISQIHGANRLGGNDLLDTVVFGKIAGGEAARLAKEVKKQKTEP